MRPRRRGGGVRFGSVADVYQALLATASRQDPDMAFSDQRMRTDGQTARTK